MDSPVTLKGGVYKIVNRVTGECYVGATTNFSSRKHTQFSLLRRGKSHSISLQRSFIEHGESAFFFEVVERCTEEMFLEKKRYWMEQLDCVSHGFNVSLDVECPSRGFKHSDESRQRMSQAQSQVFRSEESRAVSSENFKKAAAARRGSHLPALHRQRIGDANRGRIRNAETRAKISAAKIANPSRPMLGKKHSDEVRLKMSAAHVVKLGKDHPCSRPILQLDPDGRVIAEFENAGQASAALGRPGKRSNIKNCLTKLAHTAYGFAWKYKPEDVPN